jgi:membrane glycosyltransferase
VCLDAIHGHQYFEQGSYTLFPTWPEYRDPEVAALLSLTLGVLFMPKVLGTTLALTDRSLRREFGGPGRLLVSVLIEQVFSTLLAPAMMMFHTAFVMTTLAGKPVSWQAQDRADRGIGLGEALARHKWHLLLGIAWGAVILLIAPRYIWWLSPVLAGLILCVPLTMLTSRASVGRWARRVGLLLTPEETVAPRELVALEHTMASGELLWASMSQQALSTGSGPVTVRVLPVSPAVPARSALAMEAAPLTYVHPRDALAALHRLWSTPGSYF